MYEEVWGEAEDRTPNEQERLDSISVGSSLFQVWMHRELKGTFLSKEDAKHAAGHHWEEKGYPTIRFRKQGHYSKFWLLEVQSPAGDRWMTSDTFILEVYMEKPIGVPYWG